MRIECPACSARYEVPGSARARRATCKRCGATMTITGTAAAPAVPPAAERAAAGPGSATPRKSLAERRKEAHPLLASAIVVAVVSFLCGLIAIPLTLFVGVGTAAQATAEGLSDDLGRSAYLLVVLSIVAGGLVGGGVGLLLRKTWAWWMLATIFAFFLLLNLKMLLPLLHVSWGHPRAGALALALGLLHGLPALVSAFVLALLVLPRMRVAYGVKERALERRRRAGSRRLAVR